MLQYRISKAQAAKFRQALEALTQTPPRELHPVLLKAQREALESQLGDLLAEVGEYEALQAGRQRALQLRSLDGIPGALIRARIAQGLSQKQLAEKIGLKEQQVQRYEATDYATASFARIQQVIRALNLRIRKAVPLEAASK
ncbi:MAG: helix-turn-helix transcriptional regulator [Verrucomicrobiota bacterium]